MRQSDRRDSSFVLALEAWVLVPLLAVAVRLWPTIVMRLRNPVLPGVASAPRAALADDVALAVERACRRLPARATTCLPRALAVHVMLRRRGAESHLRIGVSKASRGGMRAHAWVDAGSRVIGVDAAGPEFVTLPVSCP